MKFVGLVAILEFIEHPYTHSLVMCYALSGSGQAWKMAYQDSREKREGSGFHIGCIFGLLPSRYRKSFQRQQSDSRYFTDCAYKNTNNIPNSSTLTQEKFNMLAYAVSIYPELLITCFAGEVYLLLPMKYIFFCRWSISYFANEVYLLWKVSITGWWYCWTRIGH